MKMNLISARKARGLTQGDIASALHLAVTTVFKWERGIAPVARKHWKKLASILCLSEEELEEVLVQTIADACIAQKDSHLLANANTSRMYRPELIYKAAEQISTACNAQNEPENPTISEMERVQFERAILERDKRIFELEKQVEELRRELERRRPASLSSVLNIEPLETEVKS